MGKIVLKNKDGVYVKEFNTAEGTLEFTKSPQEAKDYERGDWFASMELESIKHYFPQHHDILESMSEHYEENTDDSDDEDDMDEYDDDEDETDEDDMDEDEDDDRDGLWTPLEWA